MASSESPTRPRISKNLNGSGYNVDGLVKKFEQLYLNGHSKFENGLTNFNHLHSDKKSGNIRSAFLTENFDVLDSCFLEMLAIEDPVAIMEKLQNRWEEFFKLLNNSDFNSDLTTVVAKILAKICNHDESFVDKLCEVLVTELFMNHIPHYLMSEASKHDVLWQFHLSNTLRNLADFYKSMVPFLSRDELKFIGNQLVICKDSTKKLNCNFLNDGNIIAEEFEQLIIARVKKLENDEEQVMCAAAPDDGIATAPDDGIATAPDDGIATAPDDGIATAPDDGIAGTPDDRNAGTPGDRNAATPEFQNPVNGFSPEKKNGIFEHVPEVSNKQVPKMLNMDISQDLDVTLEFGSEKDHNLVIPYVPNLSISKEMMSFRHIPVYPTLNDMLTKPVLTPNIIQGPYKSVDHYLNIQFRLMREDLLGPLREIINSLPKTKISKNKNVYVCRDIAIGRPIITTEGIKFELRGESLSFLGLDGNKRLQRGSMLCVSANNFKTFNVAVVVSDYLDGFGHGIQNVRVEFLEPYTFIRNFNPNRRYVVVESPSYYEAYKHVLLALRTLTESEFPLKRFIIDVETNVRPPKYLQLGTFYMIPFDARKIRTLPTVVEVLNMASWPPAEHFGLDNAQLLALQAALTRELAIIQGPPGTGKTFIGLKIVETLLHNEKVWNGSFGYFEKAPILVVCYTNHALDQFLEGVLKFCPSGVVRIGGGSKSEIVSKHQLKNKRQSVRKWQLWDMYDSRNIIKKNLKEAELILSQSMKCIQLKATLRRYMLHQHYNQFSTYGDNDDFDQFPYLEIWLEVVDFREVSLWNAGWKSGCSVDTSCYTLRMSVILRGLQSEDMMRHEEMVAVDDVWSLAVEDRWRLYRLWNNLLRKNALSRMEPSEMQYRKVLSQITDLRQMAVVSTLRAAKVVGMTTTGAAKNLKVLQEVGAKIVVLEEAAKVLESHALVSVTKDCQHVIMIGDHQQLRPNTNVYDLAERCHLDVSMFERFIKNGLPFQTLGLQHRMRPEIASLLVPHIYKELRNHSSVTTYEDIRGVYSGNIFFVDHNQAESRVEHSTSRSNSHEADFVSSFCRYILNQGYEPERITVLTTYLGQLATIERAMITKGLGEIHCASVDNYQGEENDIVILSLVRSNEVDSVGFMKISNRVCVALSRAKMGFYCIGNSSLLVSSSKIWRPILRYLTKNDFVGRTIKLRCSNHLDTITEVTTAVDFVKVPEGGCSLLCENILKCGHKCQLHCHGYDKEHQEIKCGHQCEKFCSENHRCSKFCWEECGFCKVEVVEYYPDCEHENTVFCYQYGTNLPCKAECPKMLSCGHRCSNRCGEPCSLDDCRYRCTKTLDCGHSCQNLCGKQCSTVTECVSLIEKYLSCGHNMLGYCGKAYHASDCREQVTVTATSCGHEVSVICSRSNDMKYVLDSCNVLCMEELSCGHICRGTCGKCVQGRAHIECRAHCNLSLICGHRYKGVCYKEFDMCNKKCLMRCCHEQCPYPCSWPCKPCHRECAWNCMHYKCGRKCGEICDRPPCDESCMKRLSCGHQCIGLCGEMCPDLCRICNESKVKELVFGTEDVEEARFVVLVDCGHVFEVTALDCWMIEFHGTNCGSTLFRAKTCPKCNVLIMQTSRYNNNIKTFLHKFMFIKKIIYTHVDLFGNNFPELIKRWQKVTRRQLMSLKDCKLVEEKKERLDEWISTWNRNGGHFGGPTPREGFQFYREFLRVSYFVAFKDFCRYERIPSEARNYYDKVQNHLTGTYQFTVLVEEEVKELTKKLEKFLFGMKFNEYLDKFQLSKVFTRRPNWYKCECGNIFDQTPLENVEMINGCPLCRSTLIP